MLSHSATGMPLVDAEEDFRRARRAHVAARLVHRSRRGRRLRGLLAGRRSLRRRHGTFYQLLDRAPKGRDEDALLRGEGEWWWHRHDEYEDS